MTPKLLAEGLSDLLNGGSPALTFKDVATALKVKQYEVEQDLYQARKRLERDHTPTMLVTEFYFALKHEPADAKQAMACCALHGRAACGVRLLYTRKNDMLGHTWLRLNQTVSRGIQAANLDRIVVEYDVKKLSASIARALLDEMRRLQLPYHEAEFVEMMNKLKPRIGNGE